jgi:hypothetical protein
MQRKTWSKKGTASAAGLLLKEIIAFACGSLLSLQRLPISTCIKAPLLMDR